MPRNNQQPDMISKILNYPWHFVIITAVLMLQGYIINLELFALPQVLLYTLIGIVVGVGLFMVCQRFMRLHNAGLLVVVYAALFFTYGSVYESLVKLGIYLRVFAVYQPQIYLALAILVTILLVLQKRELVKLTTFLNVISLTMLIGIFVDGQGLVASGASIERLENPALQNIQLPETLPDPLPDVYYILLDAYPRNDYLLSHFGINNAAFTDRLRELGFYVADESLANYTYTVASVSSSLNMDYLQNLGTPDMYVNSIRHFTVDNRVGLTFQQMGYEYIQMAGGFLPHSSIADMTVDIDVTGKAVYVTADQDQAPAQRDYLNYLYRTTLLRLTDPAFANIPGNLNLWDGADRIKPQIEALQQVPQDAAPTFTFFHLVKPHTPVALDRDGNRFLWVDHYATLRDYLENEAVHYEEQLHYTNQRVLETIELILRESTVPPIIIVQGDHGQQLDLRINPQQIGNYPLPILNAYYFPDQDYSNLSPDIAPINSFRVVFSQYFNLDYPQLAQRSYFQPYPSIRDHVRKLDYQEVGEGQVEPPYSARTE
jgi:hypothetical protein